MDITKVELSVSCTDLPKLDKLSKSDPMCVLYQSNERQGRWYWDKEDQTEVIKDSANPTFAKTFLVEYHFEEQQHLKLILYDIDDNYHLDELYKQDYMGEAEFYLADTFTSGISLELPLMKEGEKVRKAMVCIQAEEVQESNFTITMQLYCTNLEKKDFFGKSDPYLEISKAQENGTLTLAHRTSVIEKTLNPRWPIFEISIQKLCSCDWDRQLKFACLDWNRSGVPDMIGEGFTTLREICSGSVVQLALKSKIKKKHREEEKNSGTLHFGSVRAIPIDTFLDYIKGGCEITLMIAIDFTASNGAPTKPTSLHYCDRHLDNPYVVAIKSVASVLASYDSDQTFPVFGFGAKAPHIGGVSHCFPLNGNPDHPEVEGIEGILDAYQITLNSVELHGPTNFSMFLDKAIELVSNPVSQGNQRYYLLLIITDGVITDMQNTVDRIVAASFKPLSIVIVGVGNANFSAMETLDADGVPLVDRNGKVMKRDIVQFVQLQKHQTLSGSFSLARETLAEIPKQFLSYMKMNRIKPNPVAPSGHQRISTSSDRDQESVTHTSLTSSEGATAYTTKYHS